MSSLLKSITPAKDPAFVQQLACRKQAWITHSKHLPHADSALFILESVAQKAVKKSKLSELFRYKTIERELYGLQIINNFSMPKASFLICIKAKGQ